MRWLFMSLLFATLIGCSGEQTLTPDASNEEKTVLQEPTKEIVEDAGITDSTTQETIPEEETTEKVKDETIVEKAFPNISGGQVLQDENPAANIVEVNLRAHTRTLTFEGKVSDTFYTYNGIVPGPIIRARVGDKVIVHFKNDLPETTTVHWHGLRISDQMDGSPRIQKPIAPGGTFKYEFTVKEAGTFWYHPHVRSNEQLEKGLYGMLIVQEKENINFDMERSIVLDDIYVLNGKIASFMTAHMEVMHGRNGNYLFANGSFSTQNIEVKTGAVERWRIVNVANARTMQIQMKGVKARVIGTDGGLISEPYPFTSTLTIPVGQRYDIEVMFEKEGAYSLDFLAPTQNGVQTIPLVKVSVKGEQPSNPTLPNYPKVDAPSNPKPHRTVDILFDGVQDPTSPAGVAWRLNKKSHWKEPIFTFNEGDVVQMTLRNANAQPHPFHLHGQFFIVLSRDGKSVSEPGLKDSVLLNGNEILVIKAFMDNPGQWMAHCHILEHAELGMMAEILVKPR